MTGQSDKSNMESKENIEIPLQFEEEEKKQDPSKSDLEDPTPAYQRNRIDFKGALNIKPGNAGDDDSLDMDLGSEMSKEIEIVTNKQGEEKFIIDL